MSSEKLTVFRLDGRAVKMAEEEVIEIDLAELKKMKV